MWVMEVRPMVMPTECAFPLSWVEGLPEGSSVEFEVELVGFQHEPNWASLGPADKLERAARWKEQGNALYKQVVMSLP